MRGAGETACGWRCEERKQMSKKMAKAENAKKACLESVSKVACRFVKIQALKKNMKIKKNM